MSSSIVLSACSNLLKSLNPSLLPLPPPAKEVSGSDVCFLGPGGKGPDVLCRDLPDELGMRGVIGSWYLTPERHVVEMAFVTLISLVALAAIVPRLARYSDDSSHSLRPPLFLRALIGLCFTLQIAYKVAGYPGKIYMMLMPCNVLWCLHAIHALYPGSHLAHIICQLCITYIGLPIVALANPDLSDINLPGEVTYFFVNHALLLIFPIYWVASGKVSLLPLPKSKGSAFGEFAKWYLLSCVCFALFYFAVVAPVGIYSGINLNYMQSPPPGAPVGGPNFRLQSIGCCAILFFTMRFGATMAEVILLGITSKLTTTVTVKKEV